MIDKEHQAVVDAALDESLGGAKLKAIGPTVYAGKKRVAVFAGHNDAIEAIRKARKRYAE